MKSKEQKLKTLEEAALQVLEDDPQAGVIFTPQARARLANKISILFLEGDWK